MNKDQFKDKFYQILNTQTHQQTFTLTQMFYQLFIHDHQLFLNIIFEQSVFINRIQYSTRSFEIQTELQLMNFKNTQNDNSPRQYIQKLFKIANKQIQIMQARNIQNNCQIIKFIWSWFRHKVFMNNFQYSQLKFLMPSLKLVILNIKFQQIKQFLANRHFIKAKNKTPILMIFRCIIQNKNQWKQQIHNVGQTFLIFLDLFRKFLQQDICQQAIKLQKQPYYFAKSNNLVIQFAQKMQTWREYLSSSYKILQTIYENQQLRSNSLKYINLQSYIKTIRLCLQLDILLQLNPPQQSNKILFHHILISKYPKINFKYKQIRQLGFKIINIGFKICQQNKENLQQNLMEQSLSYICSQELIDSIFQDLEILYFLETNPQKLKIFTGIFQQKYQLINSLLDNQLNKDKIIEYFDKKYQERQHFIESIFLIFVENTFLIEQFNYNHAYLTSNIQNQTNKQGIISQFMLKMIIVNPKIKKFLFEFTLDMANLFITNKINKIQKVLSKYHIDYRYLQMIQDHHNLKLYLYILSKLLQNKQISLYKQKLQKMFNRIQKTKLSEEEQILLLKILYSTIQYWPNNGYYQSIQFFLSYTFEKVQRNDFPEYIIEWVINCLIKIFDTLFLDQELKDSYESNKQTELVNQNSLNQQQLQQSKSINKDGQLNFTNIINCLYDLLLKYIMVTKRPLLIKYLKNLIQNINFLKSNLYINKYTQLLEVCFQKLILEFDNIQNLNLNDIGLIQLSRTQGEQLIISAIVLQQFLFKKLHSQGVFQQINKNSQLITNFKRLLQSIIRSINRVSEELNNQVASFISSFLKLENKRTNSPCFFKSLHQQQIMILIENYLSSNTITLNKYLQCCKYYYLSQLCFYNEQSTKNILKNMYNCLESKQLIANIRLECLRNITQFFVYFLYFEHLKQVNNKGLDGNVNEVLEQCVKRIKEEKNQANFNFISLNQKRQNMDMITEIQISLLKIKLFYSSTNSPIQLFRSTQLQLLEHIQNLINHIKLQDIHFLVYGLYLNFNLMHDTISAKCLRLLMGRLLQIFKANCKNQSTTNKNQLIHSNIDKLQMFNKIMYIHQHLKNVFNQKTNRQNLAILQQNDRIIHNLQRYTIVGSEKRIVKIYKVKMVEQRTNKIQQIDKRQKSLEDQNII